MKRFALTLLGLLSGLGSFFASVPWDNPHPYQNCISLIGGGLETCSPSYPTGAIYYLPGIFFGIALALYFITFIKGNKLFFYLPIWIIASTISYSIGVMVAERILTDYISFFIGGVVGSFLMLLSFHYFLGSLARKQFIFLVILGGVLALSGSPFSASNGVRVTWLLALFVIWQTGMAFALERILAGKARVARSR